MTLAAVVSDSHDNIPRVEEFVRRIAEARADLVIHAGDIIAPFSLRRFVAYAKPFYGVFGNNDGERVLLSKLAAEAGMTLADQPLVFTFAGKRFLVIHGAGGMEETERLALSMAEAGGYDYVIYGHTHKLRVEQVGDALVINPGELCGYLTGESTFVLLRVEDGRTEVVRLP